MENIQIKNIYPLAPMQAGMLFNALMDKESEAYFDQLFFTINGSLDIKIFEKSFNKIIERYEILRTVFIYEEVKQPLQAVLKERHAKIHFEDISKLEEKEKLSFINEFRRKDRRFDLTKDLLIRISVLKTEKDIYKVIWSHHHILMDGWCLVILIQEIFNIYDSLKQNIPLNMGKVYHYSSFIKWLEKQNKEEAAVYWKEYLEGYEQHAALPKVGSTAKNREYKQEEISFRIDAKLTKGLETIAKKNQVTLNTVFQTIWGILLQRYSNVEDVVFGSVISGRPHEIEGIENMVGLFINTIPVRIKCDGMQTFSGLIKEVQKLSISSQRYGYLPLYEIQLNSILRQDLIDHIVAFENYPVKREVENLKTKQDMKLTISQTEISGQTNYDLNISVIPADELTVMLSFNALVYNRDFIKKIEGHFKEIVKKIIINPDVLVQEIEILTKEEKDQILYEFNDTKTEYPKDKTINELFEEQVEKKPKDTAVVYEGSELTYEELNGRSNQLARILSEKGVKADSIVGIMAERSLEMIIGILGILKAGGAYLPIDPEYPEERIRYTLIDSNATILLAQKHLADKAKYHGEIIYIENENLYQRSSSNLRSISRYSNLAYIIYTSGSTGSPKGVMVQHNNLVNQITGLVKKFSFDDSLKYILLADFTFDVSVMHIFLPLITGAKLFLVTEEIRKDTLKLWGFIYENNINVLNTVPAFMQILLRNAINEKLQLKYIFIGGDVLPQNLYITLKETINAGKIINIYGPTETTINATAYDCEERSAEKTVPIGKPLINYKTYILGKYLNPVPIGVEGELYISGEGVARGYLNREKLTEENFIDNPFIQGERMYRTGDLAKWLPDGNIEFIGRIDSQVKIRGYRIELGEIESQLLKYEMVKEAVVTVREDADGNKGLCAYVVSDENLVVSALREHMSKELPEYMIPSYFIQLEKIPLTPNAKIDRKALPEPGGSMNTGVEYTAPRNEIEEQLADILRDVLGVERVGIDDDFFELGGNSIKSMLMTSKIYEKLFLEFSPKQIFETPTIRSMCAPDKEGRLLYEYENVEKIEAILLNGKKKKGMFAFPPAGLTAEYYNNLAGYIDMVSLYSFNFLYPKNYIKIWADQVMNLQKGEPCVLFGHSGGGALAYEVCKELMNRGQYVSDLIILDASIRINLTIYNQENGKDNFTKAFCEEIQNSFGKDKGLKVNSENFKIIDLDKQKRAVTNLKLFDLLKKHGTIDSNIHYITNSGNDITTDLLDFLNEEIELWKKSTAKTVKHYNGYGSHADMINPPYLEKNALIINEILKNIW